MPAAAKPALLAGLRALGVDRGSVFPDLDHVVKDLLADRELDETLGERAFEGAPISAADPGPRPGSARARRARRGA